MAVLIQGDARFRHAERPQPSPYRCALPKLARRCWKALLILFLVSLVSEAQAQAQPTEYEVKAAFIYNFAKFCGVAGEFLQQCCRPASDMRAGQ
jgi:hypothetical protein